MKKWIMISILILVLAIAGWVVELFWAAGQFKTIEAHFDGQCRQIEGVVGPEDITIHPKTGIAYISSSDRRAVERGRPGGGAIYAYTPGQDAAALINLTPDADKDFQPHGISLFVGPQGRDVLFVVNHQGGQHQIEIYDLEDGQLFHRKTLSGPLLLSPNDIVAVGSEMFYVTNDHRYPTGAKLSNVLFYNGTEFVEAASGMAHANGINVSADGQTVFVSATIGGTLHIFKRNPTSNQLAPESKLDLDTGSDNIEVDPKGDLWIGAHPKLLDFVEHARDPEAISPSQVLHLVRGESGEYNVAEVYLNEGKELSGSSVAAVSGNRLLIGCVFDQIFLDCQRQLP
mgnify:CR=1 FL=1